jgi:hypothetical protein
MDGSDRERDTSPTLNSAYEAGSSPWVLSAGNCEALGIEGILFFVKGALSEVILTCFNATSTTQQRNSLIHFSNVGC